MNDKALRQNVNRIDHIVFLYRRRNLEGALKQFKDVLGITDFHGPRNLKSSGVTVYISWQSGLELISPVDDDVENPYTDFINKRGEGFFTLLIGVEDIDKAAARAAAHGHRVSVNIDSEPTENADAWGGQVVVLGKEFDYERGLFSVLREKMIEPVAGVSIALCQIVPRT